MWIDVHEIEELGLDMPPKKRRPPSIHACLPDAKAKGANKKPKLHRTLAKVEFLESTSKPAKGKPKSAKGKGMKVEGTKKTGKVGRPPSGKENTITPKVKKKKGKKKPKDIYKGQTFTKTFPGDKTLYNGKVGNLEDVKGKKEVSEAMYSSISSLGIRQLHESRY